MQSYYKGIVPSVTPLRKPESVNSLDVNVLQHMDQNVLKFVTPKRGVYKSREPVRGDRLNFIRLLLIFAISQYEVP